MARANTRTYTTELYKIRATWFKASFGLQVGNTYKLQGRGLVDSHSVFRLADSYGGNRELQFNIDGHTHRIKVVVNRNGAACRYFLVCPYCAKNRLDLYAATNAYACRGCLHLSYISQSEGDIERLGRRIRALRRRVWPKPEAWMEYDNLFEDSYYWPKPKNKWSAKFRIDKSGVDRLESMFYRSIENKFRGLICD
tara:strand:- start:1222 stop:1809 length:588 start_codon:yes stop_codon:yes gene_type:complete